MVLDPSEQTQQSDYLKRPDVQGHLKVMEVLREWDPIGVRPTEQRGAYDEYDSYSGRVVAMLDEGRTAHEIVSWLEQVARVHMGLSLFDQKKTHELVRGLQHWWKDWKSQSHRGGG